MYSIDVIIEKKEKWTFKDMLIKKRVKYIEWFVEFDSDNSIISFEIESEECFGDVCNFLKEKSPRSRLILPNGTNIKPAKKSAKEIYAEFISKINSKEKK